MHSCIKKIFKRNVLFPNGLAQKDTEEGNFKLTNFLFFFLDIESKMSQL